MGLPNFWEDIILLDRRFNNFIEIKSYSLFFLGFLGFLAQGRPAIATVQRVNMVVATHTLCISIDTRCRYVASWWQTNARIMYRYTYEITVVRSLQSSQGRRYIGVIIFSCHYRCSLRRNHRFRCNRFRSIPSSRSTSRSWSCTRDSCYTARRRSRPPPGWPPPPRPPRTPASSPMTSYRAVNRSCARFFRGNSN